MDLEIKQLVLMHNRLEKNASCKKQVTNTLGFVQWQHKVCTRKQKQTNLTLSSKWGRNSKFIWSICHKSTLCAKKTMAGGLNNTIWQYILYSFSFNAFYCPEQFSPRLQLSFGQQVWLIKRVLIKITHPSCGVR